MDQSLLSIPLRETDTVDLNESITAIIKSDFVQPSVGFQKDINEVNSTREAIRDAKLDKANLDIALKNHFKYFHYIKQISGRFPDEKIEFVWYGKLGHRKGEACSTRSFHMEIMNIVFQIAAIYSYHIVISPGYTDSNFKSTCISLQKAAGTLSYLRECLKNSSISTTHMTGELEELSLSCLQWLMIAQAQEIALEKSILFGSLKDSAISKLAIEVYECYKKAERFGRESDFITLNWINHLTVKKYYFKSFAFLKMSLIKQSKFEQGEQVAYLRSASAYCNLGLKSTRYVNKKVSNDINELDVLIKDSLRVAEKDNNLIFLKQVPAPQEIPWIDGFCIVKPIVPNEFEEFEITPLFQNLVPFKVLQVAQAHKEKLQEFARTKFHEPSNALNNMISRFLKERKLNLVVDSSNSEGVPTSIMKNRTEIIENGGIEEIKSRIRYISSLREDSVRLFEACLERQKMCKHEQDLIQDKQVTRSIPQVVIELDEKIIKMGEYLNTAFSGDETISSKFEEILPILNLYLSDESELRSMIPSGNIYEVKPEVSKLETTLKGDVFAIQELKSRRKTLLDRVDVKINSDSILPLIIDYFKTNQEKVLQNGKINTLAFEFIYDESVKNLYGDLKEFERLKDAQISLENDIETKLEQLHNLKEESAGEDTMLRSSAIEKLEVALNKYLELRINLDEADNFYSTFMIKGRLVLDQYDSYLSSISSDTRAKSSQ